MEDKNTEIELARQQMKEAAKALGKAYGRLGGLTSAAKLSPAERSARAKKAGIAGVAARMAYKENAKWREST